MPRQEKSKAKKTDELQPDDEEEEVEEEFQVEEAETKMTSRPASKMDLEEPITSTSQNEDDENDEDLDDVISFNETLFSKRYSKYFIFFYCFLLVRNESRISS